MISMLDRRPSDTIKHQDAASCYDMQSNQPIPADDRSMAGKNLDASPRRQPPIIDKVLFPLKKRATSSGAGDSFVITPKKRRLEVDTGSDGTSAYGNPVQTHRHDTADAPPSSELPQKKLTHNGAIRSGGVRSARRHFSKRTSSSARAKKKTIKNHRPRQWAQGAELSARLEALGATGARFVCAKTLNKSDVCRNQNRLLISCKGEEFLAEHPITALLGEKEAYLVFKFEHGLRVIAFDGDGREFDMKLRYLDSNGGYRLIGNWGAFVRTNKLGKAVADGRHVNVELWAFRSPELPKQPPLKNGDMQQIVDGLEDHPDAKLGLLFLPYVDGGEDVHGAEEERELAPRTKAAVREERKLADHHAVRASRGKKAVAREVTFGEMILEHGQQMAEAVKGLLMLAYSRVVPPFQCSPPSP